MQAVALSPLAAIVIALVSGAWLCLGVWALLRGGTGTHSRARAEPARATLAREALLRASPALPLLIRPDGGVEGGEALAERLGLDQVPTRREHVAAIDSAVADGMAAAAASASSFTSVFAGAGGSRRFKVEGGPAPRPYRERTVLLWFMDVSDSEARGSELEARAEQLGGALDALSALIEAAPFPVWHRGPDLRLAMVNSAYVAAVEAPSGKAVIQGEVELIDDSDGVGPLDHAAQVREQRLPSARMVPATIAGERRMMRVVEVPIGASGIAGFAIDVEDQEQARADIARFVRAQRDMLDRLSAGVAQFGRDRSLTFFNQPFARLFSLAADFLADRPEFDRMLDAMRESGKLPEVRDYPAWKVERRGWFTSGLAADEEDWLLPGGKHLRVVAQPLPDGGLLLIFEDRTEQIQLASARDTLLRVRTATFDNLFEAIGVFASDGRLHLWNNRFRELWQLEEEHLAAHPRIDALAPHLASKLRNPSHAGLVRELVRSATVERKQRSGRVVLIDGREFEFAAVPLPDGNALFTMLDITDSRKVEAALRDRNEALEEADRLKTAFVSNMSYELRTPLTSIGGFAEMLAAGYAGELPPTAADYVRAILDSVARLSALIDNVLDLTQSDMGSLIQVEDEVDLAALCEDSADGMRDLAERRRIELALEIAPSVGSVHGDRRRLGQALGNILKNAFLYTGAGGRVLLHAAGDETSAEIVVSDNGRGIAAADQGRVFDRFHRSQDAGADDETTLGLGLPLARQFIEAHGGTIALHSEPGEGTTVVIRLPRQV
jgi:signal transduction histidine kinase